MRQPVRLPLSDRNRLAALEEAREADTKRLDSIETMVGEIHGILVKARGFKWVLDGFFKYAGYVATTAAASYGAWRFFTGH